MEESSSRKRARDEDEAGGDNTVILQAKKQEFSNINYADDDECLYEYEFHDGIGVFDFPWLKEGVTFSSEFAAAASFEDIAPTSYLQDYCRSAVADADNNNKSSSSSSSAQKQNQNENENENNVCAGGGGKKEEDYDGFWSLVVDDLEPLDCVWSCVIDDQQLLDVGFHKG